MCATPTPHEPPHRAGRAPAAGIRPAIRLVLACAGIAWMRPTDAALAEPPPPPAAPAVPAAPLAPVVPPPPAPGPGAPAVPASPAAPTVPTGGPPASTPPPCASPSGPGPIAAASATPALDAALTPGQRADKALLEALGWRFVVDAQATSIAVAGGTPTMRRDLAAAQAAGDLRIVLPPSPASAELSRLAASLSEIADSIPSRGAWQFLVAPAVERATARLAANAAGGAWVFPHWGPVPAQIFSMDPPASAWVRRGKIYLARTTPSAAIEAFYREPASTECYVAQTIAAYATQYELLGPARFDEAYAPAEITIGQVEPYHDTPIGRSMLAPPDAPWRALFIRPSEGEEDAGVVLGRLGPMAFPGLTGILMDPRGTRIANQNLTIVSVDAAAARQLVEQGGFGVIGARSVELVDMWRAARGPRVTGADLTAWDRRSRAILAEPVMRGIRVYIHPYGVLTLGEMVEKLGHRDRSAVAFTLYAEAREDLFFQRWKRVWKAQWTRGRAPR